MCGRVGEWVWVSWREGEREREKEREKRKRKKEERERERERGDRPGAPPGRGTDGSRAWWMTYRANV